MTGFLEISVGGETFCLLREKAVYRPAYRQLILGDVHLGKASHFRKKGIQMPGQSHLKDLDTLAYLLNTWHPSTVLLLGDLFHSDYNREWLWFRSMLLDFDTTRFILVEGNHDILDQAKYDLPNLSKVPFIEEAGMVFSHQPMNGIRKFNVCGHLHPGVRLRGDARQTVTLPCFYKNLTHLVLPAFGNLTGMQLLKPEPASEYYLVTGDRVSQL